MLLRYSIIVYSFVVIVVSFIILSYVLWLGYISVIIFIAVFGCLGGVVRCI